MFAVVSSNKDCWCSVVVTDIYMFWDRSHKFARMVTCKDDPTTLRTWKFLQIAWRVSFSELRRHCFHGEWMIFATSHWCFCRSINLSRAKQLFEHLKSSWCSFSTACISVHSVLVSDPVG